MFDSPTAITTLLVLCNISAVSALVVTRLENQSLRKILAKLVAEELDTIDELKPQPPLPRAKKEPEPFRVEEGEYYTNRVGEMVGPMVRIAPRGKKGSYGKDTYEFEFNGIQYHADGTRHMYKDPRADDLISKVKVI